MAMQAKGKVLRGAVGMVMLAVFVWLAVRYGQPADWLRAFSSLLRSPLLLTAITLSYGLSFVCKAAAWRIYADARQPLWKHLAPIGYSLFLNHLLPVKAGDLVRTGLAAKLENRKWDETLHTVAVMRMMDISVLLLFGATGLMLMGLSWQPALSWGLYLASGLMLVLGIAGFAYARRRGLSIAHRHLVMLKRLRSRHALLAWLLTAVSWVLEAAVPFGILILLQSAVSFPEAVWINSMTVAGQIFHVAPGGIGTYETTMSASAAALGIEAGTAFTAAVVSHAYKFLFAFAAGFLSWILLPIRMEEGIRWLNRRRIRKVEPAE
jgi:uncharacterized membrane protein YbhN (UPF0104 family)